jgi:hypothetical protein
VPEGEDGYDESGAGVWGIEGGNRRMSNTENGDARPVTAARARDA